MSTIRYRIQPSHPREHYFTVQCRLDSPDPQGQVFRLPSWIRGSYLVRDFAKHVQDLHASAGGEPVAVERLDKRSFRCAPCAGPLTLDYRVYAFDESVRKAFLDTRRGFFNASSLCYRADGAGDIEIGIEPPQDEACAGWQLATTLDPVQVGADGFGRYRAADYEELIDHPVEMGRYQRLGFDVDGIPHAMVLSGRHAVDGERLTRDLTRICHVQREMFGQEPALREYLFLTYVMGNGYGGLEHRSSTALVCSRKDLPAPGDARFTKDYRSFLGLCSHEYFHLWNVKRITAARFLESDLAAEAYSRDLWHYEGLTSYYDDLFLLRAGVLDAAAYLDLVAENATRLQRTPGRLVQTLADSSFDTWIKYYQPDENTPNAGVSYYIKGGLASLCLDLQLRLHSQVTLDDVLRTLWQRYGAPGIGVPEGGLEQVAQELSGLDLREFFDELLRSTEELPLAELLAAFGVECKQRAPVSDADAGGRISGDPPSAWVGLKLRGGETRIAYIQAGSPAAQAGLSVNDQLVAIDGLRVAPGNWPALVATLPAGQPTTVHYFRGDELQETRLVPTAPPADTWTLTLATAEGEVLARRQAWLGL
ncbi:M61 family metallopeptidase [Solimonas sp. SE-A11]|uniref:M61 family metallopeptidase n=1 Tax=Solimonas sp. SE-A11 TaxID=3054954 RepID=UPI00259D0BB5|nr:PDZ domain-containing protein [Solimonas sp. SE-A11]MDM4772530.1 PDZ domain-containing protein [Solimonas sp. SE-A11]